MYIFPLLSSAQSISFMSVKMSEVKPTIAKALPVINSLNKNIAAVADAGELSDDIVEFILITLTEASNVIRKHYGKSFDEPDGFIKDLIADGRKKYRENKKNIDLFLHLMVTVSTMLVSILL